MLVVRARAGFAMRDDEPGLFRMLWDMAPCYLGKFVSVVGTLLICAFCWLLLIDIIWAAIMGDAFFLPKFFVIYQSMAA